MQNRRSICLLSICLLLIYRY